MINTHVPYKSHWALIIVPFTLVDTSEWKFGPIHYTQLINRRYPIVDKAFFYTHENDPRIRHTAVTELWCFIKSQFGAETIKLYNLCYTIIINDNDAIRHVCFQLIEMWAKNFEKIWLNINLATNTVMYRLSKQIIYFNLNTTLYKPSFKNA